jgi:hypothetical protein
VEIDDKTTENDPIRAQFVKSIINNYEVLDYLKINILDRAFLDRVPALTADLCWATLRWYALPRLVLYR